MVHINDNFTKIPKTYLFSEIARRVNAYRESHPTADIIRMGIGDVSRPLPKAVVTAIKKAADEQLRGETFRGYGPEQGYEWLREAIVAHDFAPLGVGIEADEIFVSDGAKSDTGNFGDILGGDLKIALTDPVYPVYVDTNAMAGRAGTAGDGGVWSDIIYLPTTEGNGFVPELPKKTPDVIYLCYPNNPTGTTLTRQELGEWVAYAERVGALILFDAAYEAFVTEADVPHSIYEIAGAERVAVEFRSFSKTAGFTGTRCGYTVVPKALKGKTSDGKEVSLRDLWLRRQTTKFNGVPYIVQRGAEAVFSPEGQAEVRQNIAYYQANAKAIRETLAAAGYTVYGGVNAPYIWLKTPGGMGSWAFFDELLHEKNIVGTPGVGFGPSGEGYLRLTAFGAHEDTVRAMERLK